MNFDFFLACGIKKKKKIVQYNKMTNQGILSIYIRSFWATCY